MGMVGHDLQERIAEFAQMEGLTEAEVYNNPRLYELACIYASEKLNKAVIERMTKEKGR